jgi:hypothetical protein
MGRACSTNGAKKNTYRILVGELEGKGPLGRPRRRWVDNIKMDLKKENEMVLTGLIWLAQDRDQWRGTVRNLRVCINCWETIEWLHNWRHLKKYSAPWT